MVEEYEAHGRTLALYKEIQSSLKVPVVSPFFKALAASPEFLESFWTQVRPNIDTQFFSSAVRHIQRASVSLADSLFEFSDDYAWLKDRGFSREDMRQISYALEMFHYGLPKSSLLAAHLELSLQGETFTPKERRESSSQEPDFATKLQIIRPDSAPKDIQFIYLDILDTTHLPLIETIYQALAHWPEYLRHVWYDEAKSVVFTHDYNREAAKLQGIVEDLARQLPYSLDPSQLVMLPEHEEQIRRVASFFNKVVPGATITASGIRSMLVEGERSSRAAGEQLKRVV